MELIVRLRLSSGLAFGIDVSFVDLLSKRVCLEDVVERVRADGISKKE
jgi:hypothetical protein